MAKEAIEERYNVVERGDILGYEYVDKHRICIGDVLIDINQNRKIEETGGIVWDAGIVLGDYFVRNKEVLEGKRVVEIGAGTGFVGVCISKVCQMECPILISDTSHYVDLINTNILDNNSIENAVASEYRWGSPLPDGFDGFDVIVGSDIVYNVELFDDLVNSFSILSNGRSYVVYLAHKTRFPQIEDNFFKNIVSKWGYHLEMVESVHPSCYAPLEEVRVFKLSPCPSDE